MKPLRYLYSGEIVLQYYTCCNCSLKIICSNGHILLGLALQALRHGDGLCWNFSTVHVHHYFGKLTKLFNIY